MGDLERIIPMLFRGPHMPEYEIDKKGDSFHVLLPGVQVILRKNMYAIAISTTTKKFYLPEESDEWEEYVKNGVIYRKSSPIPILSKPKF